MSYVRCGVGHAVCQVNLTIFGGWLASWVAAAIKTLIAAAVRFFELGLPG